MLAATASPAYVTYIAERVVDAPRDATRRLRRIMVRILLPVLVTGCSLILIGILVSAAWSSYDQPLWLAIPIHLVGIPFVLVGGFLWVRRPGDFLGPVCLLLGCVWYVGDLQALDQEILFVIGFSAYHLNVVIFTHLALIVPSGRLDGWTERIVVGALYLVVPGTQLLRYLEVRPMIDRTTFGDVTAYYSMWGRIATYVVGPIAVVAVLLVIRHYRSAKRIQRRTFSIFWAAAAATGVAAAVAVVVEFTDSTLWQQVALLAYAGTLMLAAAGLLLGSANITRSAGDALRDLSNEVADLEGAIASAVGDPGLRLYVRDGEIWRRRHDDIREHPFDPADPARTEIFLGKRQGAVPDAVIVHDRELVYQRLLLHAVAAMSAAALQRQRLVRTRDEAVLDGQHAERERIWRDLHDEAQSPLSSLVRRITGLALPADTAADDERRRIALDAARLNRRLGGIVHGVFPDGLRIDGLAAAVSTRLRNLELDRIGLRVDVEIPYPAVEDRWPERIELAVYFLISEALQNVVKHSRASRARIEATRIEHTIRVVVDDNGIGWRQERDGSGLRGMRARMELLRGVLSFGASPLGGARVEAVIPFSPGPETGGADSD